MERIEGYDKTNPYSIEEYARKLIGKNFLEVIEESDVNEEVKIDIIDKFGNIRRKGGLGNLLEELYFGYKANSDQEADFVEAGVELKVSPFEKGKKGNLRAGERLVITMISYDKPIELDFSSSHVLNKIRIILLVYYLRDKSLGNNLLYPIEYISLFSPSAEDLIIIKKDYEEIVRKIQAGEAHELSEGDTVYLGACTKGSTALKSTVPQYYAPSIPARKRAFCFKNSYMTYILNQYIIKNIQTVEDITPDLIIDESIISNMQFEETVLPDLQTDQPISKNTPTYEPIIQNPSELEHTTFDQLITSKINAYIGKTDLELCDMFSREYNNNKAQWIDLSYRMLGIKSNRAEEFIKANIVVKAIRLEENGSMKESSPLPSISIKEFVEEEWENSTLYSYFEETRFLFVVFKREGDSYTLRGSQMWNMPMQDLDSTVKKGWQDIRAIVSNGIELKVTETAKGAIIVRNNLPGKANNKIIHIRTHSKKTFYILEDGVKIGDGNYSHGDELPDGRWMTKQSFWINNSYIISQLTHKLK